MLQTLLGATKGVSDQDVTLDDVLPNPADSQDQLDEISLGLSDEGVKIKMVCIQ